MEHQDYPDNELQETAPFLAELDKTNIFSVPENYFVLLDAKILKTIKGGFTHLLPPFESTPLTVPSEYFENLAGKILLKIQNAGSSEAREEIKHLSPVLYAQRNENVFTIPSGYFENFTESISQLLKPRAKVVLLKKRSIVWNCAAAAILAGMVAMSALWVTNTSPDRNLDVALNYRAQPKFSSEAQINKGIAELSDTDIIGYLEMSGSPGDDEVVASAIQEKDLPAQQDYLTDENTLEKFLSVKASPGNRN